MLLNGSGKSVAAALYGRFAIARAISASRLESNGTSSALPWASARPLTFHNSAVTREDDRRFKNSVALIEMRIPLAFDEQVQGWVESLTFASGPSFEIVAHGKGHVFWVADPVELAEGDEAATKVYSFVANEIDLKPLFELAPLSQGALIYPMTLDDSILYILVSDDAKHVSVDLIDKSTGTHVAVKLPAERAALVLIGKKEKAVIGSYEPDPCKGCTAQNH